jgi:hypothetical protein
VSGFCIHSLSVPDTTGSDETPETAVSVELVKILLSPELEHDESIKINEKIQIITKEKICLPIKHVFNFVYLINIKIFLL